MRILVLGFLGLAAAVAGLWFLRRALRRRREQGEKRRLYRAELDSIRQAVEEFERATDFDEQIRLLADIGRYCARGLRLAPGHPEIMDIDRACIDERRKLAQQWAVAESERLMKLVEESASLRAKSGRADQVAESLKVISRLLFPHEKITNAMRSVVHYQEAVEGALALPEDQREEVAAGAQALLGGYFQIMVEMKRENAELAKVSWKGEEIRRRAAELEKI